MGPSLRTVLMLGVAACVGLSGCNKLGYGELRTAPDGLAMLGAKRYPQMNGMEMQKQRAAGMMMPAVPQQQAMQQPMPHYQQSAPTMSAPALQPQPAQMPQQQPVAPQLPPNYPITPYSASPQSYHTPAQQPAPAPQAEAQQSSYNLPYEFAPGSYYNAGVTLDNPVTTGLAQTVGVTDYYSKDIQQVPSSTVDSHQKWYAPAAPVGEVRGRPLPMGAPATYNAGYGMDASYGRYREPSLATAPVDPSAYQPMTSRAAAQHPSLDPYAQEMMTEPAYNNVYYGGTSMPQGQSYQGYAPNFDTPAMGQPYTNNMLNPVSDQYLAPVPAIPQIRRSLEEPPMLARDSELPPPGQNYYGAGGYQ